MIQGIPSAMTSRLLRWSLAVAALGTAALGFAQDFTFTILHSNDIHSHVEPTKIRDIELGGWARFAGLTHQVKQKSINPIVLNAGDAFQGTIYFNVYEGLAEAAFMNLAGIQAMALGNHEFDKGPEPLGKFLDQVDFPVLAANIDVSTDPHLKGKVRPSTILNAGGKKIGIVGALTPDTPSISSPGPTVKWLDLVPSLQKEIDLLTVQGIQHIVLLSHCGYGDDLRLATQLRGVDVIVGGHSHTLLGKFDIPGLDRQGGEYPTLRQSADGKRVLVVQAWEWTKILGSLEVTFNPEGEVKSWKGTPIPVLADSPIDKNVAALVAALRKPVEGLISAKTGEAGIELTRGDDNTMGYVVIDAQVEYLKDKGVVAGLMNPGGVRRNLPAGPVNYGDLIEVQPFTNTLVIVELTGAELKAVIEQGAGQARTLIPSEGMSFTLNSKAAEGKRIENLTVAGAPLDLAKTYKIVVNSFMAGGGDGLTLLNDSKKKTDTGFIDIDALVAYFKANSPVAPKTTSRVKRI